MTYREALKLEEAEAAKTRKALGTAYMFLLISAVFFAIFFFSTRELPVIGCAFLCDAAAIVYAVRAAKKTPPFRQAALAQQCAASPTHESIIALCAAIEAAGKKAKYGQGPRERFGEALAACKKAKDVSPEDMSRLERTLSPLLS